MPQTLAELSQSLFATLGLGGTTNSLQIPSNEGLRECLLLVDGLGKNAIDEFSNKTKHLRALEYRETLFATFPSTTATSLTSLGTGVLSGEHGMVGYTMRVPHSGTPERILNALKWDERVDPVVWQPKATLFERANQAGIRTSHIAGKRYAESGFTRAALRGGIYRGANNNEEISSAAADALKDANSFAYLYLNDVDDASHNSGFGSDKFLTALERVDQLIGLLLERLPKGARLWVTSDHGMINRRDFVVVGKGNDLLKDVRLMAGEPRVRYLYVEAEKISQVKQRWEEFLGDRAEILTRSEAIAAGLYGAVVLDHVKERIGDLIVIAKGELILVEIERESQQCAMVGHHGGTTQAEVEIPLLTQRI
ncbi:MAG: alkaline phosphatase family protein [Candidatus Nanopelagicaceae bacterium]|nr:alkaline phosphatase family protein [Actinomycetota bacterium]NCV43370.1 alkaline phosphatase family protein [Actinomycetota bacterium]NCV95614.1 alkaline phosphatase family protein [Actinomycetota bacterium]NCX00202.1 alkaline phosphatase family protein [Actinomycetota bacterium]NCX76079.1 alkaline phosphatase family protein [Actinomycetota bacterium]